MFHPATGWKPVSVSCCLGRKCHNYEGNMTAIDFLILGGSGFVGSKLVEAAFKAASTIHIPFQEINDYFQPHPLS